MWAGISGRLFSTSSWNFHFYKMLETSWRLGKNKWNNSLTCDMFRINVVLEQKCASTGFPQCDNEHSCISNWLN